VRVGVILQDMKKFICDLIVAKANDEDPQSVVIAYQYFIKSESIFEAINTIKADMSFEKDSENRAIEISIEEVIRKNVPFPDGTCIVSKHGPKKLASVQKQYIFQAIKDMFKR
jgi:hypothetical protein